MIRIALLLSICLAGLASSARAQFSDLERSRLNTAAYYNYTEQGDVTIKVHVWGAVRFPGLYEIPRNSSLSELISLSGGPQFTERQRRAARTVNLVLHRDQDGIREVVFNTTMENEIVVRNEDPVLADGDVLTMEAVVKQGFRWRDLFPIVSMVGTMVLIADRVGNN